MSILNTAGKVVCSGPFSFFLGVSAGLIGLYMVSRIEEQRNLEKMQKEIEAAVKALEAQKKAAESGSAK